MKVLFVSSGNKKQGISPIVFNQGESIKKRGIALDYFCIEGKGWKGYLKHWFPLMRKIQKGNYDIIHAHYSLSGFLVTLAAPYRKIIIVSLMGTFTKGSVKYFLIRFFARYRWKFVIVKSEKMKEQIGLKEAELIPNGVEVEKFVRNESREQLREKLVFKENEKIVVFVSDPSRKEKNYDLCEKSVKHLNNSNLRLVPVYNKSHEEVVQYILAADVLMLTSFSEGSPNVIKEAMAAQCPIVTTNVGDVSLLLNNLQGTYIMESYNVEEGAQKLREAIAFGRRTEGLARLKHLGLYADDVASRILKLYS